jgi:hypothetical protein
VSNATGLRTIFRVRTASPSTKNFATLHPSFRSFHLSFYLSNQPRLLLFESTPPRSWANPSMIVVGVGVRASPAFHDDDCIRNSDA